MLNIKVLRIPYSMLVLVSLCALAACGGGGGGGGAGPVPATQPSPPPTRQVSFTVSLQDMAVRRASNGESITLDTSSVSQILTLEQ